MGCNLGINDVELGLEPTDPNHLPTSWDPSEGGREVFLLPPKNVDGQLHSRENERMSTLIK